MNINYQTAAAAIAEANTPEQKATLLSQLAKQSESFLAACHDLLKKSAAGSEEHTILSKAISL